MAVPKHIAIIMDGNGRWAHQRLMPRINGHRHGKKAVHSVVKQCVEKNIEMLTLFAFSSENKKRPQQEVSTLFQLFLNALTNELTQLEEANVKLKVIGDLSICDATLQQAIKAAEQRLSENTGLMLVIAINYGGHWDIIQTSRRLAAQVLANKITLDDIDENTFSAQMNFANAPMVDLLIRTSGEMRLSNFLLWHLAYSELYFTDVLWPDFSGSELGKAIAWFEKRQRRFGAL